MIRTNKVVIEFGFEYSIDVLRQSKLNNSPHTVQQTKGMVAEYRSSFGGAVLAMAYSDTFFIMPVESHSSIQALRYDYSQNWLFERVKFHPTEDKVYFLTKEILSPIGAGYHTIILNYDTSSLTYQTGSPYIISDSRSGIWVTDIAWIKNDYSEVLLLSCLEDDCIHPVMLL